MAYAQSGTVTHAMQAAGMDRSTWYKWRSTDPAFNAAAASAEEAVADFLESVAIARATRAENASDTLLIFLLKGLRPAKFRERHQVEHTGAGGGPIQVAPALAARTKLLERLDALALGPGPALDDAAA